MRAYRILGIIFLLIWSCKPAQVATSTVAHYSEDLSVHRPDLSSRVQAEHSESQEVYVSQNIEITGHIKEEMDSVTKMIVKRNKEQGYLEGYTIQVYTGIERENADKAYNMVIELFEELTPEITYRQPSYKVKVGHYTNRLEAHALLQSLKAYFPRALMIPERLSYSDE